MEFWNDPETAFLMLANIALAVVVLACVLWLGVALLLEVVSRAPKGRKVGRFVAHQSRRKEILAGHGAD